MKSKILQCSPNLILIIIYLITYLQWTKKDTKWIITKTTPLFSLNLNLSQKNSFYQ